MKKNPTISATQRVQIQMQGVFDEHFFTSISGAVKKVNSINSSREKQRAETVSQHKTSTDNSTENDTVKGTMRK